MTFNKADWEAGMARNHGPEWRKKLAEQGRRGGQVSGIKKGTGAMSPEKVKEISALGVAARRKICQN
jgi:hypothetical protein